MAVIDYGYLQQTWDYLYEHIGNEYGVAGLMGNLYAESGVFPQRCQGDFSKGFQASIDYTNKVDSGEVSEHDFVEYGLYKNADGYGLAQWTIRKRKQGLYDLYKTIGNISIGSLQLQLDYLWTELNTDYLPTLRVLQTATTVYEASTYTLIHFESPADQSQAVKNQRANYGSDIYAKFSGRTPPPENEYYLTIIDGVYLDRSTHEAGEQVDISASNDNDDFKYWTSYQEVKIGNAYKPDTYIIMPKGDVTIQAIYKSSPKPPPVINPKKGSIYFYLRPKRRLKYGSIK